MTAAFDRLFVILGVDARELADVKGRSAIYAGLVVIAAVSSALVFGIVENVTTPLV